MSLPLSRKQLVPCRHHAQGRCNRGKACPFAHVDRKVEARNGVMATVLKLVLEKQNAVMIANAGEVLNLAALASCPDLEKLAANIDFDSMAFCEALVSCIVQCCPTVQYICIDSNNICSMFHFLKALERSGLSIGIRGISAQHNKITSLEFIKQLSPFVALRELKLNGNPVTEKPEYRSAVRKGLPALEGLDGAGVNRPPLNVPWPSFEVTTNGSTREAHIAASIVVNLFEKVERSHSGAGGGVDAVSGIYSDDAVFSLVCSGDAAVKAPTLGPEVPRRNVVLRDFIAMRMAQTDRDNNMKTVRAVRCARGRTDVCSALRATLYPKTMDVVHRIDPNLNVTIIESKHETLAVIDLHGTIVWRPVEMAADTTSVPEVSRLFDRTVTLALRDGSPLGYLVTNDAVALRLDQGDLAPLWHPKSTMRLRALVASFKVPPEIVSAVIDSSSNDVDLTVALTEIATLSHEQLAECLVVAHGDERAGVATARVVARHHVAPADAFAALAQLGGDVEAVSSSGIFGAHH